MKKLLSLLVVSTMLLVACGDNAQPSSNENATEKTVDANASLDLKIDGMVCKKNCAASIEKSVSEMEGVQSCEINFENKTATVKFDDTKVKEEDIKTNIETLNNGAYKIILEETENTEKVETEETEETVETTEAVNNVTMRANQLIKVKNIVELLGSLIN